MEIITIFIKIDDTDDFIQVALDLIIVYHCIRYNTQWFKDRVFWFAYKINLRLNVKLKGKKN